MANEQPLSTMDLLLPFKKKSLKSKTQKLQPFLGFASPDLCFQRAGWI